MRAELPPGHGLAPGGEPAPEAPAFAEPSAGLARPLRGPGWARALLPLLVVALGLAVLLWMRATRQVVVPEPPAERVWPVQVVSVTRADHQPELKAYGQVVAGRVAELRPLVAGELVEVSPRLVEGAVVQAGEPLARIDPFDYQVALAEREASLAEARALLGQTEADLVAERGLLGVAEAQLVILTRELERSRSLQARGTASEKAVDDAALALESGRQALISRRQAIGRLEAQGTQQQAVIGRLQAALLRARRDLERTELRAPFTGYVSAPQAAVGQRVGEGDRLAELIDVAHLEVTFRLLNEDYARLAEEAGGELAGRALSVHWRLGEQRLAYQARVERVGARIDAATGGVELRARLEGLEASAPLRPGAFVEVTLPDRVFAGSIELPAAAVREDGAVYVVREGRLEPVPVRVLRRLGERVLVEGELPAGTEVVAKAFPELGPGLKVDVR